MSDKIARLYDCSQCNHLLVDPVTIPCGYSVCKHHLDELLDSKCGDKFHCDVCHKKHSVPEEGFIINKHIQNALDIRLNASNLNSVYEECKKEIDKARINVATIKGLDSHSENFIFEHFEEIKRQVDLRREELKMKIDDYSDQIIKDVEKAKLSSMKSSKNMASTRLSKKVDQLSQEIHRSKEKLTEFITQFDTVDVVDKKFSDIKQSVAVVNNKLSKTIDEYNKSLIGDKKYIFEFKDLKMVDVFGSLKITEIERVDVLSKFVNLQMNDFLIDYLIKIKFDSAILDADQQSQLMNLCGFSKDQKLELKYRASRDGFAAKNFHDICNYVSNTLTIIKAKNGNVFGGFTEKYWSSNASLVNDRNAFIFSLINKENNPFKAMCIDNGKYAIGSYGGNGPVFGAAQDICIQSNSNINRLSSAHIGYCYEHPNFPYGTKKAKNILAGSECFQTIEIEVFAIFV